MELGPFKPTLGVTGGDFFRSLGPPTTPVPSAPSAYDLEAPEPVPRPKRAADPTLFGRHESHGSPGYATGFPRVHVAAPPSRPEGVPGRFTRERRIIIYGFFFFCCSCVTYRTPGIRIVARVILLLCCARNDSVCAGRNAAALCRGDPSLFRVRTRVLFKVFFFFVGFFDAIV